MFLVNGGLHQGLGSKFEEKHEIIMTTNMLLISKYAVLPLKQVFTKGLFLIKTSNLR